MDTITTINSLLAVVIALAIVAIVRAAPNARRRASRMAQAAQRLGLSYQSDASQSLIRELRDLPLFTRAAPGKSGTISNTMTGKVDGVALAACDYAYQAGSAHEQQLDCAQTVVCFHLTPDSYPTFALYASEHVLQRGTLKFATRPIESGTTVTKTEIKSLVPGDENWKRIEDMLDPQERELLESAVARGSMKPHSMPEDERTVITRTTDDLSQEPLLQYESHRLSVECTGRWMAIFRMNTLVEPRKIPAFLIHCVELQKALSARLNKAVIASATSQ